MIAELTAAAAAAATTTALTGYLSAGATAAAQAVGKEVVEQGKGLLGWLRGKLTGDAKEALAELKLEPTEATAASFRLELERCLAADPALLEELRVVLAQKPELMRFGDQTANVVGDNNKMGLAQGKDISINIR